MTRDEAYEALVGNGFSGALEDMLYLYLGGTGSLMDRIFSSDSSAGSVERFIEKQTGFGTPNVWDDSDVWDDSQTWSDYA